MESIWPFFFVAHLTTVEEISPALPVLVWGCLIWPFVLVAFHLTMVRWLACWKRLPKCGQPRTQVTETCKCEWFLLSGTFSQDDCEKTARQFLPYHERRIFLHHLTCWLSSLVVSLITASFAHTLQFPRNRFATQPSWLWAFHWTEHRCRMPRGAPPQHTQAWWLPGPKSKIKQGKHVPCSEVRWDIFPSGRNRQSP